MSTENPFAKRRAEINKTQRQIAREVRDVSIALVSHWELGKTIPQPADYDLVAAAYQRDRAWVVESVMQLAGAELAAPRPRTANRKPVAA